MADILDLQNKLNIHFKDTNILKQAFVHASYLNEKPDFPLADNERFEFLGDAVLNFIVSKWIYHKCPELTEGKLTEIRVSLIREETLAQLASDMELGEYLLLSKGEDNSGGRLKKSNLADTFEALLGAVFLDQGLEASIEFTVSRLEPYLEAITYNNTFINYKGRLQEFTQLQYKQLPSYRVTEATGPDHDRNFIVDAIIGERFLGRGTGKSKKSAEINAARIACQNLGL